MSSSYSLHEKMCSPPTIPLPSHPKSPTIPKEGEEIALETCSQETPSALKTDNDYASTIPQSRKNALAIILILANFVPMISFGAGMGGGLHIAASLGVTDPSQASWIAASYPLTAGAFVLMSGRLGFVYGHGRILILGASWWILWSLINGFCTDFMAFNIVRGLSGVGGAMVVPNAVAIIGTTFPPGRMRNRCLGLFGAGAPIGGWAGVLMAGLLAEKVPFKWLFVFM